MRFYVPDWDDWVDAEYDFIHDESSAIDIDDRRMGYIWDLFDHERTPIDGVLLSREQVEESTAKADRLTSSGVYDAPNLDIPRWLPTISDCGAWGYKSLPFPPYDNAEMLEFYEQLGVSVGVTIDHLVLGSGHTSRIYLDERALPDDFSTGDIQEGVLDRVDVMIDEWPEEWPDYVSEYDESIYATGQVEPFDPALFEQSYSMLIPDLQVHPHAVFRNDDMTFRYELTLTNAETLKRLYDAGEYSFRLMCAIQGWDPMSYTEATDRVLAMGYQYLGIGGVAGSQEAAVTDIVEAVSNRITDFERTHDTRIDTHVFGFAKTGAFDSIGRSGITSFDSASMLRSAWTGGRNYHLSRTRKYDAIRVRYPTTTSSLVAAIERALRGQEMLSALRAFDTNSSIATALESWHKSAATALSELESYLRGHKHDARYDSHLLRDLEANFRDHYPHARALKASFSDRFVKHLLKRLREDDAEDPLEFSAYREVISEAEAVFSAWTPTKLDEIRAAEDESRECGTFEQLWPLVRTYGKTVGDEEYLPAYRDLLQDQPWTDCECEICERHGIEVAIFRGNNRNRRRGFHNTRQFYDEFAEKLPKVAVVTPATPKISQFDTVEAFLHTECRAFWSAVHDLPVAEIGVTTAAGLHEWWDTPPSRISLDPTEITAELASFCVRYDDLYLDASTWSPPEALCESTEAVGCTVRMFDSPDTLREATLDRLGYDEDFTPEPMLQTGLSEFNP